MLDKEYNQANDKSTEMSTVTSCINKVIKMGYTESFKVTAGGLYAPSKDKYFSPEEIRVINYYRFEGESDPGDEAIIYVIEVGDLKGILVNAYGLYADSGIDVFMRKVTDINKKVDDKGLDKE